MQDEKLLPEMMNRYADKKLLVHVAYHLTAGREVYMREMLGNLIETYGFGVIDIHVDTNGVEGRESIREFLGHRPGRTVGCTVHDNLEHPFFLTWVHREPMSRRVPEYDYFMYCEDDLIIPWEGIVRWAEDTELLEGRGYLRGFVRTETGVDGKVVALDFLETDRQPQVMRIGGRAFYKPRYPYHAFYLYTQKQMREFVSLPENWNREGNCCGYDTRATAASGMTWVNRNEHRVLLPLDDGGGLPNHVRVVHLPNNYVDDPTKVHGKLGIEAVLPDGSVGDTLMC